MLRAPGSVLSVLMGSDASDSSCGRGGAMAGSEGALGKVVRAVRGGKQARVRGEKDRGLTAVAGVVGAASGKA